MRKLEGLQQVDNSDARLSERRERLEYLADLLGELQTLAEREGCLKLSILISASRTEAIAQSVAKSP